MKLTVPVSLVLLLFVTAQFAAAQVIIHPGTDHTLSQLPADGGASGDNGNSAFELISSFNTGTKTIRALARSRINQLAGTGIASSRIYYEFQVGSEPETAGNTISSLITYSVDWDGRQIIVTGGTSNALILSEIVLRDMTAAENLYVETIHELDLESQRVKNVLFGFNLNDTGTKAGTIPAVLKRGHVYRLTLRMESTVFLVSPPLSGSTVESNYNGEGFQLNKLAVKLGLDDKELVERLVEIENHRHVYLTGRGEGHNNVEAVSSSPVILDDKHRKPEEELPERPN